MSQVRITDRLKALLRAAKSARFNASYSRKHPHPYKFLADVMGLLEADESAAVNRHVLKCAQCAQGPVRVIVRALDHVETLDDFEGVRVCPPPEGPGHGGYASRLN